MQEVQVNRIRKAPPSYKNQTKAFLRMQTASDEAIVERIAGRRFKRGEVGKRFEREFFEGIARGAKHAAVLDPNDEQRPDQE
jgi:hypothetical protein